MRKAIITIIAVLCCVCFACERRKFAPKNGFTFEAISDRTNIDTRIGSNAPEAGSFAKIEIKGKHTEIRDALAYTLSFKSFAGALKTQPISGKVIVPSLSDQEFGANEDIEIANSEFFGEEGLILYYIADEGGEHYVEFTVQASNQEEETVNVGLLAYQMPKISNGFADLHYDYDSKTQQGDNSYFVDLNVILDNSIPDEYTIEVKYPKSDVLQDSIVVRSDSDRVASPYAQLLPNHKFFHYLGGPAVKDTLKLIDKNIKIRIL